MKYALIILLIILPMQTFARDHLIATIGYGVGGSTVVEEDVFTFFVSSRDSRTMKAGDGIQTEFGYEIDVAEKMAVRLLIGHKFNSENLYDADHKITSTPTSALFLYTSRRVSFGGGLTYHINPRYTARGKYSRSYDDTANFDSALGVNLVLNIRLTRSDLFSLDIRYTDISYEGAEPPKNSFNTPADRSKSSYDASNITLSGFFKF